jgi:hypothetical protein
MYRRYYEAVFFSDPQAIESATRQARELATQKCESGMGCASYVTRILRESLRQLPTGENQPYGGKLARLARSITAAGALWHEAAAAAPALIIVYTPRGDHRSIAHPDFRFDYSLAPGQ